MQVSFFKYEGAGNDFILIDDRNQRFPAHDQALIERLCDRHFGIGADGLMLLQWKQEQAYMVYFNSDGRESTLCGNGGRCFARFMQKLGLVPHDSARFAAVDGPHTALLLEHDLVNLHMSNAPAPEALADGSWFVQTGSPHRVLFTHELAGIDLVARARPLRYEDRFAGIGGTNVNYVVEEAPGSLGIRTYERGVEGETLACGTGAVAAALAHAVRQSQHRLSTVKLQAPGGELRVQFNQHPDGHFTDVWLQGPAKLVFTGEIRI